MKPPPLLRHLILLALTLSLANKAVAQVPTAACIERMKDDFLTLQFAQENAYRKQSKMLSGIRPGLRSKLLLNENSDRAVLVVHGFLASPPEIERLGLAFQKQGYTVLMPLLHGFGATTEMANSAKVKDWQGTVKTAMSVLNLCYKHISLAGFSLGGTLVLDYTLNEALLEMPADAAIDSLVLISPTIKPSAGFKTVVRWIVDGFTDSISFKTLFALSHSPDLANVMDHPEYGNSEMPLKAVGQVFKLPKELNRTKHLARSTIPLLLVMSEFDSTIVPATALNFSQANFFSVSNLTFPKYQKIPHQILNSSVEPYVNATIVEFVAKHGPK